MNSAPFDINGYNKGLPAGTSVKIGTATLRIVFSLRPTVKPPWLIQRDAARYVGRCQIGQAVSLFSNCIPGGRPVMPISAGAFRIYGGPRVRNGLLPTETTDAETIGLFRGYFKADNTDMPGRYVCLVSYQVAGLSRAVAEVMSFELMPGGHQLGALVATFPIDRPAGTSVLAHTESGKVVQGHIPYLDEGV